MSNTITATTQNPDLLCEYLNGIWCRWDNAFPNQFSILSGPYEHKTGEIIENVPQQFTQYWPKSNKYRLKLTGVLWKGRHKPIDPHSNLDWEVSATGNGVRFYILLEQVSQENKEFNYFRHYYCYEPDEARQTLVILPAKFVNAEWEIAEHLIQITQAYGEGLLVIPTKPGGKKKILQFKGLSLVRPPMNRNNNYYDVQPPNVWLNDKTLRSVVVKEGRITNFKVLFPSTILDPSRIGLASAVRLTPTRVQWQEQLKQVVDNTLTLNEKNIYLAAQERYTNEASNEYQSKVQLALYKDESDYKAMKVEMPQLNKEHYLAWRKKKRGELDETRLLYDLMVGDKIRYYHPAKVSGPRWNTEIGVITEINADKSQIVVRGIHRLDGIECIEIIEPEHRATGKAMLRLNTHFRLWPGKQEDSSVLEDIQQQHQSNPFAVNRKRIAYVLVDSEFNNNNKAIRTEIEEEESDSPVLIIDLMDDSSSSSSSSEEMNGD